MGKLIKTRQAIFQKLSLLDTVRGSLIGMITAAITPTDKFISIAGAGQSADQILKEQLSSQPKEVQNLCFSIIDSLKNGKTVANVPPALYSLFRPSVQPYMISWFKYDPQNEIKKLSIPTLIIQGTNDIQVSIDDAKRLSKENSRAQLVFIENMNHICRIVSGDKKANVITYSDPSLPIADELIKDIKLFIIKE